MLKETVLHRDGVGWGFAILLTLILEGQTGWQLWEIPEGLQEEKLSNELEARFVGRWQQLLWKALNVGAFGEDAGH